MGQKIHPETVLKWDTHACFEQVSIPPGHSFLRRVDDYPWARNVWNYHPEFEIHLIRHSTGLTYVGDHIGQFGAGQLFLVGSDLPHNWITPYTGNRLLKARDIVLQFRPQIFVSQNNPFQELDGLDELFRDAARGIEFLGETAKLGGEILEGMDGSGSVEDLSKFLKLLSLFASSNEYKLLASEAFVVRGRIRAKQDHIVIERTLDYLQRNFLRSPSLSQVAAVAGMSESAFSRLFKSKTGNTFSEHRVSLRIWMAAKLLLETDAAITDICFESGFNNISNFNRTFLRRTGMKPSAYRDIARQRNLSKTQRTRLQKSHIVARPAETDRAG